MATTDYVTFATQLARLTPGGGSIVFEDKDSSGPDHARTFLCHATVLNSDYPVKGIGRARSLKEARHEAARDFVFCVLNTSYADILDALDKDGTFCLPASRVPNPHRDRRAPLGAAKLPLGPPLIPASSPNQSLDTLRTGNVTRTIGGQVEANLYAYPPPTYGIPASEARAVPGGMDRLRSLGTRYHVEMPESPPKPDELISIAKGEKYYKLPASAVADFFSQLVLLDK